MEKFGGGGLDLRTRATSVLWIIKHSDSNMSDHLVLGGQQLFENTFFEISFELWVAAFCVSGCSASLQRTTNGVLFPHFYPQIMRLGQIT